MANILPFQRTGLLISEIDEFVDKVSEAIMVLEQTMADYVDKGPESQLDDRVQQIRGIEARGDELRRSIANVMYAEMLMPDARGDILSLLDEVDNVLDACAYVVIGLAVERPELPADAREEFKKINAEVAKSGQAMADGARSYFKDPQAVRNHVHKIDFHEEEATTTGLQLGRRIFESDLPLERKRQLFDWVVKLRDIASHANDAGDRMAIFAVKRAL
ncbi:MAG: DUF47 family protein [Kiloniellales bacterium]|nr:DUF47 family protein [Kiloniellales bacterium]